MFVDKFYKIICTIQLEILKICYCSVVISCNEVSKPLVVCLRKLILILILQRVSTTF